MRAVLPRASATSLNALSSGSDFDVEGEDAGVESERHLGLGLADAGEGDALGRNVHGKRPAKLAFRHHVHAGSQPRERGEHAEARISLDRVADESAVHAGERVGKHPVMPLERRGRIAIERGSYRGGEAGKVDLLGVEHVLVGHAAPVGEMVH